MSESGRMPLARMVSIGARGVLMGGADVVPGVSGGTVALVLGIYERLVTAISRFDSQLLGHLRRRQLRQAMEHVDGLFLLCLGSGIAVGVVSLGIFMNDLLGNSSTRVGALAAFFGMIVASCALVARMIRASNSRDTLTRAALGLMGAVAAYLLTCSTPVQVEDPSPFYLFCCGSVAICAMILPGVSGAYVLVILGVYGYMTDILKGLKHLELGLEQILAIGSMAGGCAIGLLFFSRLLRWLLAAHKDVTLAILCGLMLGALPKIWPFQEDLTPQVAELKHKQFRNIMPEAADGQVLTALAIAVAAFLAVLLIQYLAARKRMHF